MQDFGISIGNILTIIVYIIGGALFVDRIRSDGRVLEGKVKYMGEQFAETRAEVKEVKADIKQITSLLVEMAKQEARIDRVEERQLAQGQRLDETIKRVNNILDTRG